MDGSMFDGLDRALTAMFWLAVIGAASLLVECVWLIVFLCHHIKFY